MDISRNIRAAADTLKKYRWAALILLTGVFLMVIPESSPEAVPAVSAEREPLPLQQELGKLLSGLDGAGKVSVLLTENYGAEVHYQTDAEDDSSGDTRSDTVLITTPDRSQAGLIRRTDPPRYLGAVVLCQGADSAAVRLAVVDAVATATGLTSDKITVLKMK